MLREMRFALKRIMYPLRGYGTNFYFRNNFLAPFATTRSFFIQNHLTKFYMVFWHIYEHFHKKSFFDDVPYWGNPRTTKRFFSEK